MTTTTATCPVCQGANVPCRNCGGQYQYGSPTRTVRTRPDGTPCTHSYSSSSAGYRCLTLYTCTHCRDSYTIDSGD